MNELYRLLQNLIRIGTVSAVDGQLARVESGGNVTDWIRWSADRAGDARTWWPLSEGEQVVMVAPGGDLSTAVIIARLYSDGFPIPGQQSKTHVVVYPDGARVAYDANSSALTVKGVKTVLVEAAESITLDTPTVICTQHLSASTFSVEKGGSMKGDFTHGGGSFSSNGVVIHQHVHGGIQRGGGNTDGPQ